MFSNKNLVSKVLIHNKFDLFNPTKEFIELSFSFVLYEKNESDILFLFSPCQFAYEIM